MNSLSTLHSARCTLHFLLSFFLLCSAMPLQAQDGTEADFRKWALTPPMGWNSWDCYYSSVTEAEVLQNAAYLRDSLLQYGWEYVVVDIRWYANHPSLGGGTYNQTDPDCVLDAYGRYLPSPTRFPSALDADGNNIGFTALADSIHAMGLKFGIHIMRGLPKYILDDKSAYSLYGDSTTTGGRWTRVYSSTTPACTWLADNLTIRNNTYGQLYYNSIVDLYASWGVDFIKVDDMSRPFYTNEISMLRNAIDQCGRPIVLSLSPGKTDLSYAETCLEKANMWRMMDDLWDSWSSVKAVFAEADDWQPYYRPGNYADCDMLPLGHIAMTIADDGYASADAGRDTYLSEDEQTTLMTLWGMAHSPLFFGGELTMNDAFTNSLLTNEEYLWMHHYAVDSHQLSDDDGQIVWTGIDPATGDRYLALFAEDYSSSAAAAYSGEITRSNSGPVELEADISGASTLTIIIGDMGDGYTYDRADLINPVLIDADGNETSLTSMSYASYSSDWGTVNVNKNVEGGTLSVGGTTYSTGLGLNAYGTLVYNLDPTAGYTTFHALCGLDDSALSDNSSTTSGCTIEFMVFTDSVSSSFNIDLTTLGFATDQQVSFYDIWQKESLGTYSGSDFSTTVPDHGAKLYRLTPQRTTTTTITLSTASQADTTYVITADVSGSPDSTAYVLWYIDGEPVGSTCADGGSTVYYAQGLSEGEHTVYAVYSGTATEQGCQSETLTISVVSGIDDVLYETGTLSGADITVRGQRLIAAPGTLVHIYSPNGSLVTHGQTDSNGELSLNLPAGTYIITSGQSAAKVVVK